jgi:hypothetical protein
MATFGFQARVLVSIAVATVAFCAAAAELPVPPAGLTAPAKPVHMPDFNLAKPTGGTVRADEFRGKVVIARFWATW